MTVLCSRFRLGSQRIVTSSILASVLATIWVLSGFSLTRKQVAPTISFSAAYAQAVASNDEIIAYAQSVLEIDGPRNEAFTEIKNILIEADIGGNRSGLSLSCGSNRNISQSLSSLPRRVRPDVRSIIVDFCNQARDIVVGNGLTVRQFNDITASHRGDPALAERIQEQMLILRGTLVQP
ncbi:MAG: DUF4168 domain-containing protein [Leptolyngbyaceae cyanobacterium MO_188.B28]|nr:DUF4168 domain-containing protein [Leptolyngbyaceae cyanobacterium MO_188.B28]